MSWRRRAGTRMRWCRLSVVSSHVTHRRNRDFSSTKSPLETALQTHLESIFDIQRLPFSFMGLYVCVQFEELRKQARNDSAIYPTCAVLCRKASTSRDTHPWFLAHLCSCKPPRMPRSTMKATLAVQAQFTRKPTGHPCGFRATRGLPELGTVLRCPVCPGPLAVCWS